MVLLFVLWDRQPVLERKERLDSGWARCLCMNDADYEIKGIRSSSSPFLALRISCKIDKGVYRFCFFFLGGGAGVIKVS